MEIQSHRYHVNGIQLQVHEAGDPEGEPLLLLHGFPEFWWGWHKQIDFFAERGYRVIVPDQRGYNLSSKPRSIGSYRLQHLTDDIAALIKQLGHKKVLLVGHDWGGAVSWSLATLYPELMRGLVILNMPHPQVMKKAMLRWPKQLLKSWYVGYFQLPLLPELSLRLFSYRLLANSLQRTSRKGTFPPEVLQRYKKAWGQPDALRSMVNWYRAIRRQSTFLHREIPLPTLLLWGKQDSFLSHEMAKPSVAWCRTGEVIFLEDASHWLHHEEADLVNNHIKTFISSIKKETTA